MNSELKHKIVSSYEASTPDVLDNIKAKIAQTQMIEDEVTIITKTGQRNKLTKRLGTIASIAAAILIFAAGVSAGTINSRFAKTTASVADSAGSFDKASMETNTVSGTVALDEAESCADIFKEAYATIYVDVNPSVKMELDENMVVTSHEALNEDAEKILEGADLTGLDYNVAIKFLVGSLYINGYLRGDTDAILVSVDTKAEGVYESVTAAFDAILSETTGACELIPQTVVAEDYIEVATEFSVSVGKMELVDKVIATGQYTEEDTSSLVDYSIRALENIIQGLDKNMKETGEALGDVIESTSTSAVDNTEVIVKESADTITDIVGGTTELAKDITDSATTLIEDVSKEASDLIKQIIGGTP